MCMVDPHAENTQKKSIDIIIVILIVVVIRNINNFTICNQFGSFTVISIGTLNLL